MPIITPDVGAVELLNRIFNDNPDDLILKLYTAISSPLGQNTVVGDFTEATDGGYVSDLALRTLSDPWTAQSSAGINSATKSQVTITFTDIPTGSTVLGLYVTDSGGGIVVWANEFGAPSVVPAGGGEINITPKLELTYL